MADKEKMSVSEAVEEYCTQLRRRQDLILCASLACCDVRYGGTMDISWVFTCNVQANPWIPAMRQADG